MRRSVLEPVVLSEEERETLERWARRPKARRLWPCGAASSLSAQREKATTKTWQRASASTKTL